MRTRREDAALCTEAAPDPTTRNIVAVDPAVIYFLTSNKETQDIIQTARSIPTWDRMLNFTSVCLLFCLTGVHVSLARTLSHYIT